MKYAVSVRLMTYMHALYIRAAMEGIMKQKTTFFVEVVIGDDFSTDATLDIVNEYKSTEKIHIKILNRAIGDAYWQNRKKYGRLYNFTNILENCSGKYIALLDGDDYWTDPYKLQKQVDILENSPNIVGCFHNSEERYWNDYSKASNLFLSFPAEREISIKELTQTNMVPTASVVFRAPMQNEILSEEFLKLSVGDWPLHLLNARKGNYYYLPQVMSVRNLSPLSTWGMQNHITNVEKVVNVYLALIKSGWFNTEITGLLKAGCTNLESSNKPLKSIAIYKKKIIGKIIFLLNKL